MKYRQVNILCLYLNLLALTVEEQFELHIIKCTQKFVNGRTNTNTNFQGIWLLIEAPHILIIQHWYSQVGKFI